jgi:predicted metal-dependent phosphoesterase TrpH
VNEGDASRQGMADMHIHSVASDGTASAAEILEYVESKTDLDVIAISDHERTEGAIECQRLARERGSRVDVVVAEEVTTRSGHLLGLFLQARLKRNLRVETTVAEIHEQGGLAIVPHPFSAFTLGMRKNAILRVHNSTDPLVYWDALEGFNPSTAGRYGRAATARLAAELGLPLVGNSDGHTLDTIGDGRTLFPGSTAEDYRRAILARTTTGTCVDWGFVREALIYTRQVRKYSRDISRWGRRNFLRDGTARDLGVPCEQLELQREREACYRAERQSRHGDRTASSPHGPDGRKGREGRSLLDGLRGQRARRMAVAAEQREAQEPPA